MIVLAILSPSRLPSRLLLSFVHEQQIFIEEASVFPLLSLLASLVVFALSIG